MKGASVLQVIRPAKLWCDVETVEEAQDLSRMFDTTMVPGFTGGVAWGLQGQMASSYGFGMQPVEGVT